MGQGREEQGNKISHNYYYYESILKNVHISKNQLTTSTL